MRAIDYLFENVTDYEWKEVQDCVYWYREGWRNHEPKFFKNHPNVLTKCYLFTLPVEPKTKIMEGIILAKEWIDTWNERNSVVLAQNGEQYHDTDSCIVCKTKKEAQRLLSEMV